MRPFDRNERCLCLLLLHCLFDRRPVECSTVLCVLGQSIRPPVTVRRRCVFRAATVLCFRLPCWLLALLELFGRLYLSKRLGATLRLRLAWIRWFCLSWPCGHSALVISSSATPTVGAQTSNGRCWVLSAFQGARPRCCALRLALLALSGCCDLTPVVSGISGGWVHSKCQIQRFSTAIISLKTAFLRPATRPRSRFQPSEPAGPPQSAPPPQTPLRQP